MCVLAPNLHLLLLKGPPLFLTGFWISLATRGRVAKPSPPRDGLDGTDGRGGVRGGLNEKATKLIKHIFLTFDIQFEPKVSWKPLENILGGIRIRKLV